MTKGNSLDLINQRTKQGSVKTFKETLSEQYGANKELAPHELQLELVLNPDIHRICGAAELYAAQFKYRSEKYSEFLVKLNEEVDRDESDVYSVGEFVMNYFDLWK